MKPLSDADHAELKAVLESLLRVDMDITFRSVCRLHPTLKNQSAFTRNAGRRTLIEEAQRRQVDARNVRAAPSASLSEKLNVKSAELKSCQAQVAAFVAAYAACIRAVRNHGGDKSLERFWAEYKDIADVLRDVGAMPVKGQLIHLPPSRDM